MNKIYPVILSGGVGSRLWPLSRSLFPKQLLPLAGEHTMIQETALRASGVGFEPPIIVCNVEHRFLIAEQMRAVGITPKAILLEPVGRNTAPAATAAALLVAQTDPEGIILLMAADHLIADAPAFLSAVNAAARAAAHDDLVTFGIEPRGPETGYGYIQRGEERHGAKDALSVKRFVEKPDRATAQSYIASGDYLWNSGMFAFKASAYLAELEQLDATLLAQCAAALKAGKKDLDFFRLDAETFSACRSISIDYAVMEHTRKATVVPVEMGWNDIGSWESLWESADKDAAGNKLQGDVMLEGTTNSFVYSDGPMVAAVGVEDLVVVATVDAVLVSRKSASQDVKKIVERLEKSGRELHLSHRKVFRPWGAYEGIDSGERFQVKRITVNPGAKLSLQMHHKRAEHWIVVSGTAQVTCDKNVFLLRENESTFIPLGATHRLENVGKDPLQLIEVQSGFYLGEDDIVRFEDTYGR